MPDAAPAINVSGFGPHATDLAARIGDGYVSTRANRELVDRYRSAGGRGPTSAGLRVCWGPDADECARLAHHLWRSSGVPGELAQELRSPALLEQAASLVTVESVAQHVACGPEVEPIVDAVRAYIDAGFDRIFLNQIGPRQKEFFQFFDHELAPALAEIGAAPDSDAAFTELR
jgi:G6PDH family F420-dependent oxidoreductase